MKVLILLLASFCFAKNSWAPLNAHKNKHCAETAPCMLSQKGMENPIAVTIQTEKKKKMLSLQSVTIGQGKTASVFNGFKNFPKIFPSEAYGLYSEDFNGDGYLDLALQASRSLKQGYQYYYWVYVPKTKKFALTNKQLPKMTVVGKNKLKSASDGKIYSFSKDNQLSTKK